MASNTNNLNHSVIRFNKTLTIAKLTVEKHYSQAILKCDNVKTSMLLEFSNELNFCYDGVNIDPSAPVNFTGNTMSDDMLMNSRRILDHRVKLGGLLNVTIVDAVTSDQKVYKRDLYLSQDNSGKDSKGVNIDDCDQVLIARAFTGPPVGDFLDKNVKPSDNIKAQWFSAGGLKICLLDAATNIATKQDIDSNKDFYILINKL